MNNLIATVAVEKTFFSTDSDFDYIIPVSLINNVKIGSMVKVPFGNGNKLRCAIVVNIYSAINSALKEIDSIIGDKPIVNEEFVALSLWLKERCFCTTYDDLKPLSGFSSKQEVTDLKIRREELILCLK